MTERKERKTAAWKKADDENTFYNIHNIKEKGDLNEDMKKLSKKTMFSEAI